MIINTQGKVLSTSSTKTNMFKEDPSGKIVLTTDEKIFNGSYGIDPVLIRLEQLLTSPKNKISIVLINIATCIRNAMDKTLSEEDNIKKIQIEIEYMVDTIVSFFNRSNVKHPYLVFYINDYIHEMGETIRPPSQGRMDYFKLVSTYCNLIKKTRLSTYENVTVNFVRLKKGEFYATQLYNIMKDVSKIVPSASYTGYYCIVSHQPLDFHLLNMAPSGILISSHTGEMLTKEKIPLKVFGEEKIPFTPITHRLFGDKYQIQPVAKGSIRKKAIEKALSNKWWIRTADQIKTDIKQMGINI